MLNEIDTTYVYNEQYKLCPKDKDFRDLSTNIIIYALEANTRIECFGNVAPREEPDHFRMARIVGREYAQYGVTVTVVENVLFISEPFF